MGIGCIVGSGIFGTLPTVIAEYGSGVIWALLGSCFCRGTALLVLDVHQRSHPIQCSTVYVGGQADASLCRRIRISIINSDADHGISVRHAVRHVFYAALPEPFYQQYGSGSGVVGWYLPSSHGLETRRQFRSAISWLPF